MTISTTVSRVTYSPNGSATAFSVPFPFYVATDLVVTERIVATGVEAVKVLDTHYTVSGGDGSTGTVTALTPPPATVQWVISRATPKTQEIDYVENDPFPAAAHEEGLDRAAMRIIDMAEQVDRSVKFRISDPAASLGELPASVTRKNKLAGYDGDGKPTTYNPEDVSFVTVTATGSTTARPTADRFAEVVNVLDYGAVGDGVTDDTTAFGLAVAAAAGKTVFCPKGTYLLAGITLNQALVLTGAPGAVLKLKTAAAANLITVSADNVTVRGLTIDGNRANQSSAGAGIVVASGADNVTIEENTVAGCYGTGIAGVDNCQNLVVRRNTVTDIRDESHAIDLVLAVNQDVWGTRCENNLVDRSAASAATISGEGIRVFGGSAANTLMFPVIRGNRVRYPRNCALNTVCIEIWFCVNAVVEGNTAEGGQYGISHAQVHESTMTGNVCVGQNFISFELAGCQSNAVAGLFVDGEQNGAVTGVSLGDASGVDPVKNTLTGVNLKDVGRGLYALDADGLALSGWHGIAYSNSAAADYYYITIASTVGFSIAGCYLNGAGVGQKGIFLDNSDKGAITGNDVRDWVSNSVYIYAHDSEVISDLAISGNWLLNVTQDLQTGATLDKTVRVAGNRMGNANAYQADWLDLGNYVGDFLVDSDAQNIQNGGSTIYAAASSILRRRNGAKGRHLYIKESGTAAALTAYGYRTLQPIHPARMYLYDDFLGAVDGRWGNQVGTHGSIVAPAFNSQAGGVCRLVTGADALGTMATNGVILQNQLIWQAQGADLLIAEFRVKLSAITDVALFIGFTDQIAALEMPIHGAASADTITTNATDAVGVMFDTAMATDNWWLVGVKADADATAQNAGTAPVAGTYETWRVELNNSGNAAFFRNDVLVGSFMANAVTAAAALTPVVAAFSRAAATRNVDLDLIEIQQIRP